MIPKELQTVLSKDAEVVHGAICFAGTRVPVQTLIDYQEAGLSTDAYLTDYPTVSRTSLDLVLKYLALQSRHLFDLDQVA